MDVGVKLFNADNASSLTHLHYLYLKIFYS